MNLLLLNDNYPYAIINLKNRNAYYSILENIQEKGFKEHVKFSNFVYERLIERSKIIEKEIDENIEVLYNKL